MKKTQIYLRIIVCFVLTVFATLCAVSISSLEEKNAKSVELFQTSIENQWRTFAKSAINTFESELLEAVSKNEVDPLNRNSINKWVTENISMINNDELIADFAIVDIGYSIKDRKNIKLDLSIIDNQLDEKSKTYIENQFNSLLECINESTKMNELIQKIDAISKNISSETKIIDYEGIKKILLSSFLTSGDIISGNYLDITSDSDDKLTEIIYIPNGILGFNDEPAYIYNEENMLYKKLAVYVSINKSNLIKYFDSYLTYFNSIILIFKIMLSISFIITIAIMIYIFYVALISTGGDKNVGDNENTNVIHVDNVHIDNIADE